MTGFVLRIQCAFFQINIYYKNTFYFFYKVTYMVDTYFGAFTITDIKM